MLRFGKPDVGNAVAWGFIGLVATLICTVLGVWMKDLTVLLTAAWFFSLWPIIIFTTGVTPLVARNALRVVFAVVVLILLALLLHYRPKADPPRVSPTIVWVPASPIKEGDPLSPSQLNASAFIGSAPIEGVALYNPTAGATLPVGTNTLSVRFTPKDPSYLPTEATRTVQVIPHSVTVKRPVTRLIVLDSALVNPVQANKSIVLSVKVKATNTVVIDVLMKRSSGIQSVFEGDPIKQKALEDEIWNSMQSSLKHSTLAPLQTPGETVLAMTSTPVPVSEEAFRSIAAGQSALYFLFDLTDTRGKTLREFCAYVRDDSVVHLCRSHNGP